MRDVLGQVTEVVDPLGHKTTKEYDAAANLTKLTDPAKRSTTYTYDPANQLTEVSYSDGKTPTVTYEYDADGNRIKMVDGTGTTSYSYDQLDRLTKVKDGHGDVVSYHYDLGEQQTTITYPNGKSVTRAYDKAGRLEKITDWLEHVTKFGYDASSNQTATVWPSGTSGEDKNTYNEAEQLTKTEMKKGAETLASLTYTRDNLGQVKAVTQTGLPGEAETAYTYDERNRLTKAGATSYEYDASNNATKTGASTNTYNEGDELEKSSEASYSYDELGDRTKRTPTSGPATTYGYDEAGNLTSVTRAKEGETPAIEDSYGYDGNGIRASQTVGATTSYLAWDPSGTLPLLIYDGSTNYIYGPNGLPIEQIDAEGHALLLHHDQQGSTRMLTSTTGAVEGKTTYDTYGNIVGTSGTATTALGFDGAYTNSDTGLIYLRARSYDPATAQMLTRDPLGSMTGEPYSYAGDNPTTFSDPSGLIFGIPGTPSWSQVGDAITSTVGGAVSLAYDHSGEIASVSAGLAAIPGVDAVAAPVSVIAGLVHGYKSISEGQYVAAVFDAVGVSGGLAGLKLAADSKAWDEAARSLWSRGYLRSWAWDESARLAIRARGVSFGGFVLALLSEGWRLTDIAQAAKCN